jgi:hypothetical protein
MIAALLLALAAPLPKADRAAMQLTPAQIAASAEVTGIETLDPALWISTRNFLPRDGADRWLRAYINKATGEVEYQLYLRIESRRDAFRPRLLTFQRADGLGEAKIDRIDHDVNCYRSSCWITEHAIAVLSRADLEAVAQGARAGVDGTWAAKVFGDSQEGVDILTFKTEIAGLLIAVDREMAKLGRVKAP